MAHTKIKLAEALRAAGLHDMADHAAEGYYHDFLSPLALPATQLLADLRRMNTPAALALAQRAMAGEFDATAEEADEWANSSGLHSGLARVDGVWVEIPKPKRPPDL